MFAVKTTNLHNGINHFEAARNYSDACDLMRRIIREVEPEWVSGIDYQIEVVEIEEDFDFDNQPDFN